MAFGQAIELEGDVPARYIALAKAEEKLGNTKKAISALENAYELDPKVSTLRQILAIYESTGDTEAATATAARVEAQIVKETQAKKRRVTARTRGAVARTSRKMVTRTRAKVATKPKAATKTLPKAKAAPKVVKPHAGRKRV